MSDQSDTRPTADDAGDMDAMSAAGSDVEYMFALTGSSLGVNLNGRITIHDVSATTLFFSDRPYRLVGHVPTPDFVSQWGVGDDNFAEDPPNALLSIFEDEAINDVVVILTEPQLSNGDLSFAVEVTDGDMVGADGPVSLFIDMIGRPLSPMSVAGVHRRGRRRGRRRATRRMR